VPSHLNPYLNFRDNAREALEFYRDVFGGDLTVMSYKDGGMPHDPAEADKVMHGQIVAPNGFWLMASDVPAAMGTPNGNGSISLSGDDEADLRGYWDKLSAGATILEPLRTAPWGDSFGMLVDRFGVSWLVNIAAPGRMAPQA
jgi:PhnB protein